MRKFSLRLCFFIWIVGFFLEVVVAGIILDDNILLNPGFELGSNDWLIENGGIEIVNDFAFTGSNSLRFNGGGALKREVSCVPKPIMYTGDTKYILTINYFNDMSLGSAHVVAKFLKGVEVIQEVILGDLDFSVTDSWLTKRFLIEIPDYGQPLELIQISLIVNEGYPGGIWFDDLALQPVLPGKNMLDNPGFEDSATAHTGWIINKAELDTTQKHSGLRSSMIEEDSSDSFKNIHSSQFTYSKGDIIRVTFYHRLDTTQADFKHLETRIRYSGKETFYEYKYWGNQEVNKWIKQTYTSSTTRDSDKFAFYYLCPTTFKGKTWIDDIEIFIIPADSPEPVQGFAGHREQPERILCQWQPNEKEPFRYNVYMSQEQNFEPGMENLVASVPGDLTSYEIEIPYSRINSKYYLAITAIDGGGQESNFAFSETLGASLAEFIIKNATTGESIPGAVITIGSDSFNTDENGRLKFHFVEGTHNYLITKMGYVRKTGEFDIYPEMPPFEVFLEPKTYPPPAVDEVFVDNEKPGLIKLKWLVPEPMNDEVPYKYEIYKSELSGFEPSSDYFIGEIEGIEQAGAEHIWLDYDVIGGMTYFYHVVAINDALIRATSFEVEAYVEPPMVTSLISPVGSKPITAFPLRFEWGYIEDAVGYELQIADNIDFVGESLVLPDLFEHDETTFILDEPLASGEWFWRVKTHFESNIKSAFTVPVPFRVVILDENLVLPYFKIEQEIFNPYGGSLQISFALSNPAKTSVSIYTPNGKHIETVLDETFLSLGGHQLTWNGKENGMLARNGPYVIKFKLNVNGKEMVWYKKFLLWKR